MTTLKTAVSQTRLLEISHKYGICSLFSGKCNFGVVLGGAIIVPYFKPHRGAFAAFPKQNGKCLGGGGMLRID